MDKKFFLNMVSEKLNELNAKDVITASANVKLFEELRKLINQLDEPRKVIIPRFVAEWIEAIKGNEDLLFSHLFDFSESPYDEEALQVREWARAGNEEKLARAWLDGYEVEQEKLYTVEIPDPNYWEYTILKKRVKGEVVIDFTDNHDWSSYEESQLTEAEIKQDFEWAWQWAEEVKE